MSLLRTLQFIIRHPLNRGHEAEALLRWARWQVGSRILPGPVAVPYVNDSRMLVAPGMTGATGNLYCGLHEFEDMAFVLHALRPQELFVDVGANIGSYSILAAMAGARCVACEPVPETFQHLLTNIRLNGFSSQIDARNVAIGGSNGRLRFTKDLDTMNHVLAPNESGAKTTEVDVCRLDDLLANESPVVIKIDVEGYEMEVIRGSESTLSHPGLAAVVMELNGSGARYGYDEQHVVEHMTLHGYSTCAYSPLNRRLSVLRDDERGRENTLFVRNPEALQERCEAAPRFRVLGREL
jgi:FkbM family methyltransferase